MKIVDSSNVGQLLVAAYQQLTQKLTHEYPTIAYEDIQDAICQATTNLLVAGGLSMLLTKQSLYQYLYISAQRNIWHYQKRSACMVRLEAVEATESSLWVAEGVRADDTVSRHILREAIEQQVGEENATIIWRYVINNDKPQEIAEDLDITTGTVYARLRRNLKKLECLFSTPPPRKFG